MSNGTFNITTALPPMAKWTIMPVFCLITFVFGLIGNSTLLLLFMKNRHLRTPFNVYLINLLIANLFCVTVQYPMDIVTNLYAFTWSMGNTACTVYLYACSVLEGAILNSHQLIAINRIWAVVHPISYRSHHSIRTAILLCIVMWLYVHLVMSPGLVMDTLYYRLPVNIYGCRVNGGAQPILALVTSLLIFDWPEIVMLLVFPIIYFSRRMRRRTVPRNNTLALGSIDPRVKFSDRNAEQSDVVTKDRQQSQNTTDVKSDIDRKGNGVQQAGLPRFWKPKRDSHAYFLLGMLVVSVTVCWTPFIIFYLLVTFTNINAPTFYQVATILFSCQTTLDPILFTMALASLRNSLRRTDA